MAIVSALIPLHITLRLGGGGDNVKGWLRDSGNVVYNILFHPSLCWCLLNFHLNLVVAATVRHELCVVCESVSL